MYVICLYNIRIVVMVIYSKVIILNEFWLAWLAWIAYASHKRFQYLYTLLLIGYYIQFSPFSTRGLLGHAGKKEDLHWLTDPVKKVTVGRFKFYRFL